MGSVRLDIHPDPGLVRAGRLVAVCMARVAGLDEEIVEDVRLVVGEACGRAVAAHQRHGLPEPIALRFDNSDGLAASVADRVALPAATGSQALALLLGTATHQLKPCHGSERSAASTTLALLEGLSEQVTVRTGAAGTTITLHWRTGC